MTDVAQVAQGAALKHTNGTARKEMTSKGEDKENGRRPSVGPPRLEKRQSHSSANGDDVLTKKDSTKKRRKVNHACIYCRRSHMTCDLDRPCNRCIKRNIGHLCHDEPRETLKKSKSHSDLTSNGDSKPQKDNATPERRMSQLDQPPATNAVSDHGSGDLPQDRIAEIIQPSPVSAASALSGTNAGMGFNDWTTNSHTNNFQDMHSFHASYMFNTTEVNNEFNLLNEFLSNSLLDDGAIYGNEDMQPLFNDASLPSTIGTLSSPALIHSNHPSSNQMLPPSQLTAGNAISRPTSGFPIEKGREAYYMTAADPAGNESAEERMNKLLKAKYDAGILRPFNYVKGYTRLDTYMRSNIQMASRQKILRQLDRFRPKFREKTQGLTDLELVLVEIWFERSLMEYDRVFASMAVPACCWRRTGEIFRGNKEMAELIRVPTESLRDGKIALHEILAEASLVSYWESFGHIAFDTSQKAILTSCSLKSPNDSLKSPVLRCCFSFTIKRDAHDIPTMIVGNFLPIKER